MLVLKISRFYQLPNEEVAYARHLNPMCEVFPRVASCTYWKYGTGGRAVGLQALCILSLNIVIDKVNSINEVEVKFVWQISCPPANGACQGNYLLAKM